ncbi:low molecular weight protein-tyrosine-phosphatase [Levilactobacillus bambusae]|uniref:protein-tyrosine-phosphatase n=1 Tax=Levilactobacillus bambusae TaxID=2024736 RepID=A0A2V1MWN9_9LACO|nr:low molecular weight protein-tyrosine-phosphatase [Levilactobacillus bambusae]PWF99311.1 protein-tyrosine-phosphatase [Levilactobacillus bambusae]
MEHVLFVCLGNICRSPMAEAMFKQMVADRHLTDQIQVESRATSTEEEGNPPHPGAQKTMRSHGLDPSGMVSQPITAADFDWADVIITMDQSNLRNLNRLAPTRADQEKVHLALETVPGFAGQEIPDPWYSHRFEDTYQSLNAALPGWLDRVTQADQ